MHNFLFQFLFLYPSVKNAHAEVDLKLKTNNIPANAIPSSAVAFGHLRYVVGTQPEELMPMLRSHLDSHGFEDIINLCSWAGDFGCYNI